MKNHHLWQRSENKKPITKWGSRTAAWVRNAGVGAVIVATSGCEMITGEESDTSSSTADTSGTPSGDSANGPTTTYEGRSQAAGIEFQIPTREVDEGAWLPVSANGVKPYSFSLNAYSVLNRGEQAIEVEDVVLEVQGGFRPENWKLKGGLTEISPDYVFEPFTLQPGEGIAFNTLFRPVETGMIEARIILKIKGNKFAMGRIRGRGRDAAFIVDEWEVKRETGWGHSASSSRILTSGMVLDDAGNAIISGNVNQWHDNISHDIAVARINADGTEAWARVWHEEHQQEQPDSGQNNQTGGVSRSIDRAADGSVYVVGKRSTIVQNSAFDGLVLKINPADGSLAWAVALENKEGEEYKYFEDTQIYAVSAAIPGRVLVTGTYKGSARGPFLAALSATDGSLLWVRGYGEANPDRAYTIVASADGVGYTGGVTAAPSGLLARWTGLNGDDPKIEWSRAIGIPRGSLVQDIDIDPAGNAYVAYDIRGAETFQLLNRFNRTGDVDWTVFYNARPRSDRQTTSVIRWRNDEVWAGGLLSTDQFDSSGDGFIMKLKADTGAFEWMRLYYTGTTDATQGDDRIKGIGFFGNDLVALSQHWTGGRNVSHYWGFWYGGVDQHMQEPFGDGSMHFDNTTPVEALDTTANFTLETLDSMRSVVLDVTPSMWKTPPAAVGPTPLRDLRGNGGHYQSAILRLGMP